jgi:hypothetical protein
MSPSCQANDCLRSYCNYRRKRNRAKLRNVSFDDQSQTFPIAQQFQLEASETSETPKITQFELP